MKMLVLFRLASEATKTDMDRVAEGLKAEMKWTGRETANAG